MPPSSMILFDPTCGPKLRGLSSMIETSAGWFKGATVELLQHIIFFSLISLLVRKGPVTSFSLITFIRSIANGTMSRSGDTCGRVSSESSSIRQRNQIVMNPKMASIPMVTVLNDGHSKKPRNPCSFSVFMYHQTYALVRRRIVKWVIKHHPLKTCA